MGGCFNIDYTGQNITTANLSSTNNYKNGSKTTITISKSSSCKIYTEANIYIHTNNTTTAPIDTVQALRYKIVSEDNVEYDGYISRFCDVLMATVPIEETSKTYTVYLWIDNSKSYGEYNGKSYSGYVYATSIQTSTIEKDDIPENYLNTDCPGITNIGFSYIGKSQAFTAPKTGTYKLEVWGAQGGQNDYLICEGIDECSIGGTGGYSSGYINLEKNQKIYLQVGGSNKGNKVSTFNGGGFGSPPGGGATSITTKNRGELYNFENYQDEIIMVAGGGGGDDAIGQGGHGGGFKGSSSYVIRQDISLSSSYLADGGTQTNGGTGYENGSFGQGGGYSQYVLDHNDLGGAGGGGFYGGGAGRNPSWSSGGGGSGYIGNSLLSNKSMYCYECEESNILSTKTISTTCSSEEPIEKCAKFGNGYAKITFIE